jgi:TctA family transporter
MWIGNVLLVILNLPLIRLWTALLKVPYSWLFSLILILSCFGIYSLANSHYDVLLGAFFGVLGYVFLKLECPLAPFILGLVSRTDARGECPSRPFSFRMAIPPPSSPARSASASSAWRSFS